MFDADGLFSLLRAQARPAHRVDRRPAVERVAAAVSAHVDDTPVAPADLDALVADLNAVIAGPSIWEPERFAERPLDRGGDGPTRRVGPTGDALVALNRRLLDEAFPVELHDAAIATADRR